MAEWQKPLRLSAALAVVALGVGACASIGGETPATLETAATGVTATQSATAEVASATSAPIVATATIAAATDTPAVTATPSAAPSPKAACAPPMPAAEAAGSLKWVAYCDTRNGFGFRYPTTGGDEYAGNGRVYLPYLLGTNLHQKILDVTVAAGGPTCSSPASAGYAPGTVPTENMTFNGIAFVQESGSDAGAGNYYDWTGYSTFKNGQCISLTFTLHSVNRLNYDTPPPQFDAARETAVYSAIMSTFSWITP